MNLAIASAHAVNGVLLWRGAQGVGKSRDTGRLIDEGAPHRCRAAVLHRLGTREESRPALEAAVAEVAKAPDDDDFTAALRGQVKKALAAEPALAEEIVAMLNASLVVAGPGSQVVSGSHIGGDSIQISTAHDVDIRRG